MPLKGPDLEDRRKLHAEVNQLVNQRLALTTLAVTIFGAMVAWLVPRDAASVGSEVGGFRYFVVAVLILVEFALFVLSHQLRSMLRIITAYLDVSDSSGWEFDWSQYRDKYSYLGYTKPQSIIFLIVGLLAGGIPFVFRAAFPIVLRPRWGAAACLVLLAAYVLMVWGMGYRGWFLNEDRLKEQWQAIKKKQDQSQ